MDYVPTVRWSYCTSASVRTAVILLMWAFAGRAASEAYLPVVGGPEYVPGIGGYRAGGFSHSSGTPLNDAGNVVAFATRYDASGTRMGVGSLRWDAAGRETVLAVLGTDPTGASDGAALAINVTNTAVGYLAKYDASGVNKGNRPVRWDANGAVTELAVLGTSRAGSTTGIAYAVNAAEVSVGYVTSYDAAGAYKGSRPVRWDPNGTVTELAILGTSATGTTSGAANVLNAAGVAAGSLSKFDSAGAFQGVRPVRWDVNGAATEMAVLGTDRDGFTGAQICALSDRNVVAGSVQKYDATGTSLGDHPVRWDASGAITELGVLGADTHGAMFGQAYALNVSDTVAGYVRKYDATGSSLGDRPVRWGADGAVTELGMLGTDANGFANGFASAINSVDVAAGYVEKYDATGTLVGRRAIYWAVDGSAVDLNSLIDPASGWTLTESMAITDSGWIGGTGTYDPDGPGGQAAYGRLFTMQVAAAAAAAPEPGLSGLAVAVALRLSGRRRCRRRRAE